MRWYGAFWFVVVTAIGCARTEQPARVNDVEIVASDYAFKAPQQVPAGRTTFRFTNNGKQRHELNITRLKKGVSTEQMLTAIRADQSVKSLTEGSVGVLFAEPGGKSSSGLTVDLMPGQSYAVICIFRDSAGAKPHYDLGMSAMISVTEGNVAAPASQAATDTIIATDYAYQYPRTLAPGRHTFWMRNDGKQRHELTFLLLKKGVTLARLLEVEKSGASIDSLFDGDLGLLHARGGEAPIGNLTFDMLADREYLIACFFQDDEKSPEHYKLGMFGSIRTPSAAAKQ